MSVCVCVHVSLSEFYVSMHECLFFVCMHAYVTVSFWLWVDEHMGCFLVCFFTQETVLPPAGTAQPAPDIVAPATLETLPSQTLHQLVQCLNGNSLLSALFRNKPHFSGCFHTCGDDDDDDDAVITFKNCPISE